MTSKFSAGASVLGYMYQFRYGLMLILSRTDDEDRLFIEKIDDISIETDESLDIFQTKLHLNSAANLTDASPDLWKTLRIWSENIKSGQILPCILNLVTTAKAPSGSICFDLKADTLASRDKESILGRLIATADSSLNVGNKPAYEEFLSLKREQQILLIRSISIVDRALDIADTKIRILNILKFSTTHTEPLFERLEGWYMDQVLKQLLGKKDGLSYKEVRSKVLDIADCLKIDNLPSDFNTPLTNDISTLASYKNKPFVKQLETIGANQKEINGGISDYHRAYSQKSKWLREGLINALDEIEYHNRLKEDWERKFATISDSAQVDGPEEQKNRGRIFYQTHYVVKCPDIHIKGRFKEHYMVTGCCHDLANTKNIGWHPDFENLV